MFEAEAKIKNMGEEAVQCWVNPTAELDSFWCLIITTKRYDGIGS